MDSLFVVVLVIFWVLRAVARSSQKKQREEAAPSPRPASSSAHGQPSTQPVRPAEVDLPGQMTVPIHWEGYVEQPVKQIMADEKRMADIYHQPTGRPSDVGDERDRQEKIARDTAVAGVSIPGLDIDLDADSLVKGVIFSEILNRRTSRRL